MAVVDPANLAPDTLPRVRGVFLTRPWKTLYVAAKWPRKRGPPTNWAVYYTSTVFGYAGKMAANPEPMSYATAVFWTKGTHWLPRDMLTMLAYGKGAEIVLPDGTSATQAYHGPPPEPLPRPMVTSWLYSNYATFYSGTANTTAFAFKGHAFTARESLNIYAAQAVFTPVVGRIYKMVLAALDASNVITALYSSSTFTATDTEVRLREFDLQGVINAGTRYALMIGCTSASGTTSISVPGSPLDQWLFPHVAINLARLAQAVPAVGQTVDVAATGTCALGLLAEY